MIILYLYYDRLSSDGNGFCSPISIFTLIFSSAFCKYYMKRSPDIFLSVAISAI